MGTDREPSIYVVVNHLWAWLFKYNSIFNTEHFLQFVDNCMSGTISFPVVTIHKIIKHNFGYIQTPSLPSVTPLCLLYPPWDNDKVGPLTPVVLRNSLTALDEISLVKLYLKQGVGSCMTFTLG